MIDSSTIGNNPSSWKKSSYNSEADGKMLESAFASIQISSMDHKGNRPPALSVSSISSFGEDLHQMGIDFNNHNSYHIGMPSSPLSNASSSRGYLQNTAGSGHSPIAAGFHHEGASTSINYFQSDGKGPGSQGKYSTQLDNSSLYTSSAHNSLPIHIKENGHHSQIGLLSHSFQDLGGFSRPHGSSSDLADTNGSPFGNWPPTNARSSHSLSGMGSVAENEQYFPNRARAVSATDSFGYHRSSSSSFAHSYGVPDDFNQTVGSPYGFHSSEKMPMPVGSPMQSRVRTVSHEMNNHNPRQRVMSADAVPMNERGASSSRIESNSFSNINADAYGSQSIRPRSFSSGQSSNHQSNCSYRSTPPGTSAYITDANNATLQPHPYTNGRPGGGNSHLTGNDLNRHYIHRVSPSTGRPHMYDQQYHTRDVGYTSQDRMINVQQGQGYQSYGHYHHNMQMPPRNVYTVKFKRSQKNFFLSDHIKGDIKIGSHVKVEADRGEDLGIVLSRVPIEHFNPGARLQSPHNMGIPDLQLKRITRLASDQEFSLLILKEEEEAELLKICRSKTLQRGLPMRVVDAEYQFDRHKLTFFFEASCRVDFRELVRDLFGIYKTRIWMQQIDKVPGTSLSISRSLDNVPSYGNQEVPGMGNGETFHSYGLEPPATDAITTYNGDNGEETY